LWISGGIKLLTKTFEEELTWLMAHVENMARRHGRKPEEICDVLMDMVCS
jgi:hypothetical protein